MKTISFLSAMVFSISALAMSSPLQMSKRTLNLVVASVALDELSQIRSIENAQSDSVLVTYVNAKGVCLVQRVPIVYDELGMAFVPETPLQAPAVCK
ncbi:MAG: hypothetical protein H7061_03035 [Bdellovibrionaceae bacterium]|nr:hypothetical protein [Bdellovibrio sp.]